MAQKVTREKIIQKGAELIYSQGFNATGLQQILKAAGVPKGSFYFYFKSKEDFGLAVIDHFSATISEIFSVYLNDRETPPVKRLGTLLEYFEDTFQKTGCSCGCPIGNLSLELADTHERLRLHLQSVIEKLVAKIESCIEEAKRDKSLPADLNASDAAYFIFHGFEGAILNMKVAKNIEPFRIFRNCMSRYFSHIK